MVGGRLLSRLGRCHLRLNKAFALCVGQRCRCGDGMCGRLLLPIRCCKWAACSHVALRVFE